MARKRAKRKVTHIGTVNIHGWFGKHAASGKGITKRGRGSVLGRPSGRYRKA